LANPEITSKSSTSPTSSIENFPSLPSQPSQEQEMTSTFSSPDVSVSNNDEIQTSVSDTQSESSVVINDLEEQRNEAKETQSFEVLEQEAEDNESAAIEDDLKSQLNGNESYVAENLEQNDSGNVKEDLEESNLDNGLEDGMTVLQEKEVNDDQNNKGNSLEDQTESHVNCEDFLTYENSPSKLKQNLEISICDKNNAENDSNDIRNCGLIDEKSKACSKEVLPQQSNGKSERAIDCPS
jgi:hypothetical protein